MLIVAQKTHHTKFFQPSSDANVPTGFCRYLFMVLPLNTKVTWIIKHSAGQLMRNDARLPHEPSVYQCKFGITCKFHHPQPTGESALLASARPFYSTVQSPSAPSPEQYAGPSAGYRVARPPLEPGSYPPGAYGPILLSPGMVPLPNWSPYSGRVSPVLSPGAQPSVYGVNTSAPPFAAQYRLMTPSPGPISSSQTERVFPERPGQPECQYYMKTGDCKFGASCKYHHPPDWAIAKDNCMLSPMGLPLRPVSASYDALLDVAGGKVNIHVLMVLAAFASEFMGNSLEGGLLFQAAILQYSSLQGLTLQSIGTHGCSITMCSGCGSFSDIGLSVL